MNPRAATTGRVAAPSEPQPHFHDHLARVEGVHIVRAISGGPLRLARQKPLGRDIGRLNGAQGHVDKTLGSPKAPITLIEYAAPMCPHCAHFNAEVVPLLISNYVNLGKVYYVFRVFPIGAADVSAEALARCQPADNYFQFIDLLFRNQAKWDPEYGATDVHGALVALGRIAGMSPEQVDACMNNQDEQKRIMAVAQDASTRYGVTGTPTLVINGEVQEAGGMPWTVLKTKLDSLLAKK